MQKSTEYLFRCFYKAAETKHAPKCGFVPHVCIRAATESAAELKFKQENPNHRFLFATRM